MKGNEKADALANEGAEADGETCGSSQSPNRETAAKKFFRRLSLRCFHVQIEEWKDRDEIVQMDKANWQLVLEKREAQEAHSGSL